MQKKASFAKKKETLFASGYSAAMLEIMRRAALIILLAALTLPLPVAAGSEEGVLTGGVTVIDGDGFKISGVTYRLWGIDAPETGQTCERPQGLYPCGMIAREVLRAFIGDDRPRCAPVDQDRFGRTVARCTVGGVDLASMMVNAGWALDWPRYSNGAYRVEQDRAQSAARGLWGGPFVMPWEWRKREF